MTQLATALEGARTAAGELWALARRPGGMTAYECSEAASEAAYDLHEALDAIALEADFQRSTERENATAATQPPGGLADPNWRTCDMNRTTTVPTASKLTARTAGNLSGYLRELRHNLDQLWRIQKDPTGDAETEATAARCFYEAHQMLSLSETELDELEQQIDDTEREPVPVARLRFGGRALLVEMRGHLVSVSDKGANVAHGFLTPTGKLRVEHTSLDLGTMAAVEAVAGAADGACLNLEEVHAPETSPELRAATDRGRLARFTFGGHEVEVNAPEGGADGDFDVYADRNMVADGTIVRGRIEDLSEETTAPRGVVAVAVRIIEASLSKRSADHGRRSA